MSDILGMGVALLVRRPAWRIFLWRTVVDDSEGHSIPMGGGLVHRQSPATKRGGDDWILFCVTASLVAFRSLRPRILAGADHRGQVAGA